MRGCGGSNLTASYALLYVSLALAVSTLRDNRFYSANVAGMRAVLYFVPCNFSRSILRAADFTRNAVKPRTAFAAQNQKGNVDGQGKVYPS